MVDSIRETFGNACVPVNLPSDSDRKWGGVVEHAGNSVARPGGHRRRPAEWNQAMMDAIVEANESLMERYLDDETLSAEESAAGLSKSVAAGTLIPNFFVSSKAGVGVAELMNALGRFAVSPLELPRKAKNAAGEEEPIVPAPDGPLIAQIFKTRIDPYVTEVELFAHLLRHAEKGHRDPRRAWRQGDQSAAASGDAGAPAHPIWKRRPAGDVAVVGQGRRLRRRRHEYRRGPGTFVMPHDQFPTPRIGLAVEPEEPGRPAENLQRLQKIAEEDRTLSSSHDSQPRRS